MFGVKWEDWNDYTFPILDHPGVVLRIRKDIDSDLALDTRRDLEELALTACTVIANEGIRCELVIIHPGDWEFVVLEILRNYRYKIHWRDPNLMHPIDMKAVVTRLNTIGVPSKRNLRLDALLHEIGHIKHIQDVGEETYLSQMHKRSPQWGTLEAFLYEKPCFGWLRYRRQIGHSNEPNEVRAESLVARWLPRLVKEVTV